MATGGEPLLLLIWKHFFFYFINGYLFTRQLKRRLFVIRGLNLNQNWRYISVSMCDSNDVKFTGKVCGLDEPIQCVSTRPPLAQIRPNWLGSIDVLAVYYLEEFLNASRPRLRVFPRRNSSFLFTKTNICNYCSSNSVRSLARGYQCCTRGTTDTKVVVPIKVLITFCLFYVKNATFTNRQRERENPQKRLSETRSLSKSSDSSYRARKRTFTKRASRIGIRCPADTITSCIFKKNAPKHRNTKGKELSKCWCNLSDTIKSVSSIKTLRSIIQTPVLYQISWNGEASWTSIFRVIGWNTLNNYKFHFSL